MRSRDLIDVAVGLVYIVNVSILSTYILAVLKGIEGIELSIEGFPIFIGIIPIEIPAPMTGTDLAVLLVGMYTAMAVYDYIRRVDGERPLTKMYLLGTATLVAILGIEAIQSSIGIETGMLETESDYVFFLSAMQAPIAEEIGFRLMIIGIISLLMVPPDAGKIGLFKAFIHPYSVHRDSREIKILYLIAVIQALFFGLAHLLAGGGWDIGKVSTASLAGIYLGYLFIRYGFTTAVLGHAFFNVYLLTMGFASTPDYPIHPGVATYTLLLFLFTLIVGGIYLIYMAYQLYRGLMGSGEVPPSKLPDVPNM